MYYQMYYQIQKAERPAIRDTDHPFTVPNQRRTQNAAQPQKQKKSFTLLQFNGRHTKGPTAAGFTNETSCS